MSHSSEIYVLGKKVRLLQPEKGFRTSIDSVLVAAACPVKSGQHVLDMGCGVGAVGFCILQRVSGVAVTGIDIQKEHLALAHENAVLNNVLSFISFQHCDIREFTAGERFDHVVCNPPFLEAGQHIPSPEEGVALARGHGTHDITIKDWVDAGFRNLKPGGSLSLIHRADATDRILQALGKRFGAVEIIPLWPRAGVAAKRVIIRALKDRKSPAILNAGLVLHKEDGCYTQEVDLILRNAVSLFS
ncbi:MAG: methyltransferase [Alphaproteobacteria bacterium CG_4_9_14_3_um_filter_47_13]|nr:MAG: methyltransferase [Alphaproteobacteria bacterium CG_4_9_14_3_um_filter_47_13]